MYLVYYIFFAVSLIWLLYKKQDFIVWLPFFYIVLDSSFSFFPTLSIVTFLRPAVFFILFSFFIKKIPKNGLTKDLYLFLIYTFILVFFSSQIFYSFKGYLQVFISMMCFPLGYIYFNSTTKLRNINKVLLYLILFSVFSSAVGYLFGWGRKFDYDASEEGANGLLGSSGLYSTALAIGILPLLLTTIPHRFWRWILFSSSLMVFIFILINMRRTAIFIPIVGLLTFAWFTPNKSKIFSGIVLGVGLLLLASPLYLDKLISRYNVRADSGRFDEDFYKTENRFIENVVVFTDVFSFNNPVRSLFGDKIYASGRFDDRKARMNHSDPANLLAGTGIIGVFLYIMIYISFFRFPRFCKNKVSSQLQLYKTTYYSLLFISLFVSLNGSLMLVSLRSILFLYLGAMLSLMYRDEQDVQFN